MNPLHRLPVALTLTLFLAGGVAWFAHSIAPAQAAEEPGKPPTHDGLVIEISGIEHDRGKVMVMIYDDEAAWEAYDAQRMASYYEFDAVESGVRGALEAWAAVGLMSIAAGAKMLNHAIKRWCCGI